MLAGLGAVVLAVGLATRTGQAAGNEVPLVFTGGHVVGTNDFCRPVPLIAAALGVQPDEFRQAFSGVRPAKGRPPTRDEARKNKQALMQVLGPLGVTNDRLDDVSDYYRYRPQKGELWPTKPAKGYAVVEEGQIKKLVITEPGSGYSSPPQVTIKGLPGVTLEATLHFDPEFSKNGSIESVEAVQAEKPKP
jgi:hypothetical protein